MSIREKTGKRMKMIRLYANLKQKDLARELDMQPSVLSMYEQGNREPNLSFLSKFCDYFNISISHFFTAELFGLTDNKQNDFQNISRSLGDVLSQLEKLRLERQGV